jgi:hypothetical protein
MADAVSPSEPRPVRVPVGPEPSESEPSRAHRCDVNSSRKPLIWWARLSPFRPGQVCLTRPPEQSCYNGIHLLIYRCIELTSRS